MTIAPIKFRWQGDGFTPASDYHQRIADRFYTIGEEYFLVPHQERSTKSHNHYFASIADGWGNLPDHLRVEYPTAEHLRKKALIRTGYYSERAVVCASKHEALRIAAFMRPIDEYAIVDAREATVKFYTAESQKKKAMGAKRFQQSKTDVLNFIDDLLGTARGEVSNNAGKAA